MDEDLRRKINEFNDKCRESSYEIQYNYAVNCLSKGLKPRVDTFVAHGIIKYGCLIHNNESKSKMYCVIGRPVGAGVWELSLDGEMTY